MKALKCLSRVALFITHITAALHDTKAVQSPPKAHTLNGTYVGAHLPTWNQDVFLGMPFAKPPVDDLRFRWPMSIGQKFDGERNATEYGFSCMQYGQNYALSEDCLTINVVRPAGKHEKPLPVLVWIYGGGLFWGSTADQRYNMSGIVKVSQDIDQPVLAVSFNYRLGLWGFLQSFDLLEEGSSNAGLLDQKLALKWIQENIASFGGDPGRVVIWGESAGAQSIAYQMFSYDGHDEGLYHGAILESGGITGAQVHDISYYSLGYENLTRTVGCWENGNVFGCLRKVKSDALFASNPSMRWNPLVDGTFLTEYPSQLIKDKKFNAVPMIIGTNTDETFSMGNPNTTEDLYREAFQWRNYALSPPTIRKLLDLYPSDPCNRPPHAITNCSVNAQRGLQWRRGSVIGSDLVMHSGRRKMARLFTDANMPVYSYRFDQRIYNRDPWDGVKHFDNVAFSFQNISGELGPSPEYDSHAQLSRTIGETYINFVNNLDPNPGKGRPKSKLLPHWPKYDLKNPKNMVLNATKNWVESDNWRKEGIDFINSYAVARELYS